jgi:hypothetical protein
MKMGSPNFRTLGQVVSGRKRKLPKAKREKGVFAVSYSCKGGVSSNIGEMVHEFKGVR